MEDGPSQTIGSSTPVSKPSGAMYLEWRSAGMIDSQASNRARHEFTNIVVRF